MPYLPHCKVILTGVLGTSALTPSEIWSSGHQISDTNIAGLPSQAQVDTICQAWATAFASGNAFLCSNAYLTRVDVVAINADGTWRTNTDGSYMKHTSTSTLPKAGNVASQRDYPVSSVVTLMTPRAGAHGRGRMYLPLPAELPDESGHSSDTVAASRASAAADAFQNVNAAIATGAYQGVAVVASRAGFLSPITAVRVGNVHDTQRRRRNNLSETYAAHAV